MNDQTTEPDGPDARTSDEALLAHWRSLDGLTPAVRELHDLAERLHSRNAELFRRLGEHADDLGDARRERDALAAQLDAVRAVHYPVTVDDEGHTPMGHHGDGTWGAIRTACHGCGPLDEYAAPWPCPTARALDVDQATPTPDWADVRAAARDAGFTLLRDHDHKIRSWRYRQNGQTFTASLTYDPGHLLQSATWHASIRANRRYVEIDGPTPAEVLAAARLTRLDGDDHA